jgi:hypothetical protein
MAPPNKDALNKEDLFLLLESYKNSVEMNTVISQQLTNILEVLQQNKTEHDTICTTVNVVRDKVEAHDKELIKGIGSISNKVNLLYVAFGSIVVTLIGLIILFVSKSDTLKAIATHLGVL